MTTCFAQPYDMSAHGFFFSDTDTYTQQITQVMNAHGQSVEEFEIQFIDGEAIDDALFQALGVHQGNVLLFLEKLEAWDEDAKTRLIIAIGECGYPFDVQTDDPEDFDIDLYALDSLRELAEQFVEEGLYGNIPEHLAHYIDYDAIARDLSMDYCDTTIAGQRVIYRYA